MSKSLGNVIDPSAAMADYSVDGLRYFLVREATPHSDASELLYVHDVEEKFDYKLLLRI